MLFGGVMEIERPVYQTQDSSQTLREALEEYRATNPNLFKPTDIAAEGMEFLERHDRIHVVFGCDTRFVNEMRADFWTIFGCDLGLLGYARVANNPALKMIGENFKKTGDRQALRAEIRRSVWSTLKAPFEVFFRSRSMKKRFPWNSDGFLDSRLGEIREEFGIKIL